MPDKRFCGPWNQPMFDVVERLKTEWTDRYVVVDSLAPELARFSKATGLVKTVNMNGRCLVEFDQYNNIGWYDIDPSFLKIVPKPLPKPVEPKAAKTDAPPKPAPTSKAATPAATSGVKKPSVAEILAKARGGKAASSESPDSQSAATVLASPAESIAPAAIVAPPPPASPLPPASPATTAPKQTVASGPMPTTTAEKIAWCRVHDAQA